MFDPTFQGPTTSSLVLRALRRYPHRIAFSWDGGTLTYAAVEDLIGRLQAVFAAEHGALRAALLSTNRADVWCAEAAVQALGGSVTWLHPLASLPDHLSQVEDSEASVLIVDPTAFKDRGGELAARLPQLETAWTLGPADFGRDLLAAARDAGSFGARDLSEPGDIATLNYTGGTTGRSKAAVRRQAANAAMTRAILADFEIPLCPRFLAAAPISHAAGTKVLPVLLRGGTVHLGGSVHLVQRFDPDRFLDTVQRQRINMSMAVPTMIYTLLDTPSLAHTDLSSLEVLFYGAAPMSPTRLEEAIGRIGPVLAQLYGQTECYPISYMRREDHDLKDLGKFVSCGSAVASTQIRLLDADGEPVAAGQPGEMCVRAPHAMEGYWKREELTLETFKDGWMHTGDIAHADDKGFFYIVDRKNDMIISSGFNVYPRAIEDILTSDPSVAGAAVFGVPDAHWGEVAVAVVVARPGAQIDTARLEQSVHDRKGFVHVPKRIEVVPSLPLTSLGKVDKKALRAPYWAGTNRSVA
jgi:fatty-acyl-CoA synthase